MDRVYYVGLVAQLLTYVSFLSGAKVCHLIHKQRSCNKLSAAPFLAGLGCTALWLRYGLIADEWEIITVNLVGLSCQIIYLGFFVVYSKQRLRLMKQLLILVIFLALIFWSIQSSSRSSPDNGLFLAGSIASLSSLVACASPLATIQDVLKTRCVASLPFPIIASSCVVSFSWLTFGLLKGDEFIVFSNMVALGISGAQLGLFLIYPSVNAYEKLSPSNKKSYDLIKLLSEQDDDDLENLSSLDDSTNDEIDTNQDYKATLTRVMGQIYLERQRWSKNSSSIMLLFASI